MLFHAFIDNLDIFFLALGILVVTRAIKRTHVEIYWLVFWSLDISHPAYILIGLWLHRDVLLLLGLLDNIGGQHVYALIKIDVGQVREIDGDGLFLHCANKEKAAITTIGGHFHISDCLGWEAQAI